MPEDAWTTGSMRVALVPDVVVHRRGTNDQNLLVVEVKKSLAVRGAKGQRALDLDARKLRAYRDLDGLRYRFSAVIIIPVGTETDSAPRLSVEPTED